MRRVAVGHDDEVVGELAVRVVQREVALVHEHGVDDDLLGDAQELLVEGAHEHGGLLAEVHDLQQRLLGKLGARTRTPLGLGHAGADDGLASLFARDHVRGLDDAQQIGGRGHLMGARRQETMAAREVAGLEAREPHGDHALVQQRHEPAHWAREVLARGAPAARLRPRDAGDHAFQHAGQELGHVARGDAAGGEHVLHTTFLAALECADFDALAAREARGGLRRVAVGVERDLGGGASEDLFEGSGLIGHIGHDHDEAPRRGVDGHVSVRDAHPIERFGHEFLQLLGCAMQVERRNLLGADLECERMQVTHSRPPSPPWAWMPRHHLRRPRLPRRA